MAAERLVVIGGDAVGMSAASQVRRRRSPDQMEIISFERGPHTSYSACGIPYLAGGVVDEDAELVVRSPETFREKYSIDARVMHEVTEIDVSARRVKVVDLSSNKTLTQGFDHLLIATGSSPVRPKIDGIDSEGIFAFDTLQSGIEVRTALDTWDPTCGVVVGGGYIGLEMAEAFLERGLDSSLVEARDQPMFSLDPDMGDRVAEGLRDAGVDVFLSEEVVGFDVKGGRVHKVITKERELRADIVALGIGSRPNAQLAADAGIRLGSTGAIATDDHMRTSVEGIWAAGDCAEQTHRITGDKVNIHLGTVANKMGRITGMNIAGEDVRFPGVLGTAVTKVCGIEVGRTGLAAWQASEEGFDHIEVVARSATKAGYYPGNGPVWVKLVAEEGSGRLLGAQIVGAGGSAKRIDTFATALWLGATVDEMEFMDLSYAPPFSPVWDPVLIAVRRAIEELG